MSRITPGRLTVHTPEASVARDKLAELAVAINEAHAAVEACFSTGLTHAIRVGELLKAAKELVPHGEWLPWLAQNCTVSARSAQRYMLVADRQRQLAANTNRVSHLSLREGLELVLGPRKTNLALLHTGDPESYTPGAYVEAARSVMGGIDVDPASNEIAQKTVKANTWYGVKDDGLAQRWEGRVFLNPPYSYPLVAQFIQKLCEGFEAGEVSAAVLLTNNNTDTGWWHMAVVVAAAVCFTRGRINFYKADGSLTQPTNGQTLFYFGRDLDAFISEFSKFGRAIPLHDARRT